MISGAPLHENGTLNSDGGISANEGRGPSVRFEGISLELSSFAGCRFDFAGDGILVLTFDGYKGVVTLKSTAQPQQHQPHDPLCPTGSEAGLLGVLEAEESLAMDHVDYGMALSQLEQGDSSQQHQHRQLSLSPVDVVSTEPPPSPAGMLLFSSPSAVRQACEGRREAGLKIDEYTKGRDKSGEVSATSINNGKACPPSGPPSARQLDIENQRAPAATLVSPSSSLKNASHTINEKLAHKHKHAKNTPHVENASAICTARASSKTCTKKRSARAKVGDGPKKASAEASASAARTSSKPRGKRARRGGDKPTPAAKAGGKSASVSSRFLTCSEPTVGKENRAREDDGCAPEEASMVESNSNADGVPQQEKQQQGARAAQEENEIAKEAMSPAASAAAAWIAAATPMIPSALSRFAKAQILEKGEDGVTPMGRWGHSATMVSETQMLVLGGQADDDAHQATLGDLHKFDFETCSWSRPMNCDSIPRAWHTASFIAGKNLLVIFGGERTVDGCPECLDDIMVLDTDLRMATWASLPSPLLCLAGAADIDLLYPPAISGKSPTARSGHSAAIIGTDLVVFGGVRGRKWQNNVAVLDTERWHWRHPTIDGSSPAPRSYHSATVVGPLMVVFGGNNQNESFDMVNVLDTGKSRWEWSRPEMVGAAPPPRTGHSAVLLPDGYTIMIHGGWDPEDEGGVKNFGDAYLMDTRLWEWSRGPETLLGTKDKGLRVGHTALLARGGQEDGEQEERGSGHDGVAGGWKAAFFGGQDGEGVRRSEVALLSL